MEHIKTSAKYELAKLASDTEFFREWHDCQEFFNAIKNTMIVWSWGARDYHFSNNRILSFKVSGAKFKGYVAIGVNVMDTLNVYLIKSSGALYKEIPDIYIDEILNVLDREIETK